MTRDETQPRRRVLRGVALTGATALVAGCGGPGTEDDEEPDAEEETGNGQDPNGDPDDEDLAAEEDEADLEGDEVEGPDEVTDAESWDDVEEILLRTDEDEVWVGEEPSLIADEENPTLELTAGEEYQIGYRNADGEGHNLSLLADEDERMATDVNNEEGDDHWLSVEADDELTAYRCEVHPDTMDGEIEVGDD